MSSEYSIRYANKSDITQLVSMWQSIDSMAGPRPFGGDTDEKPKRARELILHAVQSSKACVLVCCHEQQIIGTISGHVFEKPAVALSPLGVIYSLWVEEPYRQQGVGVRLLRELQSEMKTLGAKALQVGWDSHNQLAGEWWLKQGYSPYEVIASKVMDE